MILGESKSSYLTIFKISSIKGSMIKKLDKSLSIRVRHLVYKPVVASSIARLSGLLRISIKDRLKWY